MLRLLHSGPDRWSPGITATLHQWHDVAAMLARIPDGARRAGFGGLGLLIDTAGERIATVHTVFRLRLGGSGQYRIEPVLYPRRRPPGGAAARDRYLRRRAAVADRRGRGSHRARSGAAA